MNTLMNPRKLKQRMGRARAKFEYELSRLRVDCEAITQNVFRFKVDSNTRLDAQSYLAEGLVKVHNRDTLNKFAPDDTRRTFGDVSMGAFFYYCSPEFDYKVAPNATAWQRINLHEALPVTFIYRTDDDALKVSPTTFGLGDIVAGVKVSQ